MVNDLSPQNLNISGRKILVTGAAQGIGQAVAKWLYQLGATVVIADIKNCDDTINIIGKNVRSYILDLSKSEMCNDLINEITNDNVPLYGLVNCAGLLIRRNFDTITQHELDHHYAVNQSGVFFLARAAFEVMRRHNIPGRIILYTSQGAFNGGLNGSTHYAMNKAAITALVKSMARLGGSYGITVNAIAPGAVDTQMFSSGMTALDINRFCELIPIGRIASTDELAAPTAFLLSDWARYITGTTLHVNGGQLIV
jgi:NAD(P)-dependent dehydrogenase (short-subunit alcohol dehydrogenase family)